MVGVEKKEWFGRCASGNYAAARDRAPLRNNEVSLEPPVGPGHGAEYQSVPWSRQPVISSIPSSGIVDVGMAVTS